VRYELGFSTDADGRPQWVGWTVSDEREELIAMGSHQCGDATNFSHIEALALALVLANENVELNGGVQAALQF
jgi:hypothetical protein